MELWVNVSSWADARVFFRNVLSQQFKGMRGGLEGVKKFLIFKLAAKFNSCQEQTNDFPLFCLFYIKVLLLCRDFLFNTKHAVILIAPTPIFTSITFQTGHKPIQRGSCYLFRGLISNINLMKCCVTWQQEYGLADDLVLLSPYMTIEFEISRQNSTPAWFVG